MLMEILLEKGVRRVDPKRFEGVTEPLRVTILEPMLMLPSGIFDGCEDVTIRAHGGSFAEFYAQKHGLKFERL